MVGAPRTAVVAGAGVGGLCAGIGLAQCGWDVTILERWPEVVGRGAGIGLWPDAQAELGRLGLGPALRSRAVEFGPCGFFTAAGRRLGAVPTARVERSGGAPVRILPRTTLVDLLHERARTYCAIRTGTDIRDEPDLVANADLVVGADGIRSSVRPTLPAMHKTRAAPVDTGYVAFRGSAGLELGETEYGETWAPGVLVGVTRLAPGRTNVYIAVQASAAGSLDEVRRQLADWRSPVVDVLARLEAETVIHGPIEELRPPLPTYAEGRTVLIGDAAHAMSPNLGRGACEAILDAGTLARLCAEPSDVPTALQAFDQTRRRPTQRMVSRSRMALRLATTRHTVVRDWVARAIAPLTA